MKVLYFTRTQSPHDLRFTRALAETSRQVTVLCLEPECGRQWPGGIKEIEWQGLQARSGRIFWPYEVDRLRQVLRQAKPDVVHAGPIQTAAYLTALAGFHPLMSMSWGSDLMLEAGRNWLQRKITRYSLAHTDVLVGDCACVGEKARSFGFELKNYFQFPWGVDVNHFNPEGSATLRRKLGWQHKVVLLSTRSFEPLYGMDVLIQAFIGAAQRNPDLRLILLGGGSQESLIRKWIAEGGMTQKVHFGGKAELDELPDIYRSADFYLSASHSDGSSVSLMEALACGLPVIVSDIPGNREWVREGEQGWFFRDGDALEFSRKILDAASSIANLGEMKMGNRVLAESRADWKKNFPVLLKAYDKAFALAGSHD